MSDRHAGVIDELSENETCGCGQCCETCWADCCATDDDIQVLNDLRDDLGYSWSVCTWWSEVYGPDAVLVSPRDVVLHTQ